MLTETENSAWLFKVHFTQITFIHFMHFWCSAEIQFRKFLPQTSFCYRATIMIEGKTNICRIPKCTSTLFSILLPMLTYGTDTCNVLQTMLHLFNKEISLGQVLVPFHPSKPCPVSKSSETNLLHIAMVPTPTAYFRKTKLFLRIAQYTTTWKSPSKPTFQQNVDEHSKCHGKQLL